MHRSALLKDVWWHWHALKKVEIYTLGPSGLEDHMPVYRIYSTSYCDISIDHKNDIYIYISLNLFLIDTTYASWWIYNNKCSRPECQGRCKGLSAGSCNYREALKHLTILTVTRLQGISPDIITFKLYASYILMNTKKHCFIGKE